jgi:hypothetical protein
LLLLRLRFLGYDEPTDDQARANVVAAHLNTKE